MILFVNGAFGIGKTSLARELARRIPRSVILDPERIGFVLQRSSSLIGRPVGDFQDLPLWRWATARAIRLGHLASRSVLVPMAFSNSAYLDEIRTAAAGGDSAIHHFCLVAPLEVIRDRLRQRGMDPRHHAWEYQRAAECHVAHRDAAFAIQLDASGRSVAELADDVLARVGFSSRTG